MTEPAEGPPPRRVEDWTTVPGHVVTKTSPMFCGCGEWRAGNGTRAEQLAEARRHLRDAWPVLVPKNAGESRSAWRERIAVEHHAALEERHRLEERDGLLRPTPEGGEFPVLTGDYSAADDRVEVLEWWLDAPPFED
jgi:hypothetical protein